MKKPTNDAIAEVLERIADLLDVQDANPFRVRAYREGAQSVRNADRPVADMNNEDLQALPNIGGGIAAVVGEYVSSGKSDLLQTLEAQATPEAAFVKVPGLGKELAQRIVDHLHIQTLPELEEAAHDGRLATVEGFGERRVEAIRTSLAGMLGRTYQQKQDDKAPQEDRPSIALLLDIDAEYRQRAEKNDLPKIAPRRFNPDNEAWLPILNTKRDGWDFTALFSNTAQAHKLEKTHDWVVIYYERDGKERQNTVVTETKGPLKDKRVVRGREGENRRHYSK